MVFGHERGQGYTLGGLVLLCAPSDCLALYDGYLGVIDGFYSANFICGNCTVPGLVLLDGLF